MGCIPIPPYANIFMAHIDSLIKNLDGAEALIVMKRFLDDYFKLFQGSTKDLHALFAKINKIHPTIKFTMSHTSLEHKINVIAQR